MVRTFVRITVVAITAMAFLIVLAAESNAASRSVQVPCGANLATAVNSDPKTTATRFVLSECVYNVSSTLKPEDGDEIAGPVGTFIDRQYAKDPEFGSGGGATIRGSSTLDQVMKPQGTFRSDWIKVEGGNFDGSAGSGVGIAGGQMASDSVIHATRIADTEGAGISNFHGHLWRSELTNTTTNPSALGFIGSGVKGVDEFWVSESYVHDNQGNGIWCDEECNDQPLSNGKFTVWYSLIVNNGRDGVRWEKVGSEATHGEALIYLNNIHGNGRANSRAGVGIRDAQDAVVRDNLFGSAIIAGITYPKNYRAWSATDSGRSDRPNLAGIQILENARRGDAEKGCDEPDHLVLCANNTP